MQSVLYSQLMIKKEKKIKTSKSPAMILRLLEAQLQITNKYRGKNQRTEKTLTQRSHTHVPTGALQVRKQVENLGLIRIQGVERPGEAEQQELQLTVSMQEWRLSVATFFSKETKNLDLYRKDCQGIFKIIANPLGQDHKSTTNKIHWSNLTQ